MDKISPIVLALLGTGGLGTIIAFFVVPASTKWKSNDERLLRLESEVAELKEDVSFLRSGVTALSFHSDGLRLLVLRHDPTLDVPTAREVLEHVRINIDNLTVEGNHGGAHDG